MEGCSKKLVEGLQLLHDTMETKNSSTKRRIAPLKYLPAMSAVTADKIDYSNQFYDILHSFCILFS